MINTKTAISILWTTLTCVVIFGSFILKNQVHELENELSRINKEIQSDAQNIQVLKAQWSQLNNPKRLRKLASEHILLNNVKAEQIINYSALPFKYEDSSGNDVMVAGANKKQYKQLVKAERE
ncbi:MAG: hypothetical protein E7016_03610 [Alphaproteobacteria bacterium]|nr:hypothetical protein [Alphaproteobacteria bacterium]